MAFIKAAAELGYEVTEQDFPDDDLAKLDEKQLDDVAGGAFWLGSTDEENNELWCLHSYWRYKGDAACSNSPTRLHKFEYSGYIFNHRWYKCVYCKNAGTYREGPYKYGVFLEEE